MKKIRIPKNEVLHYMQYNTKNIKESIEILIDQMILEVESLNYKVNYVFKDIVVDSKTVMLSDGEVFESSDLSNFLKDCNKAIFIGVSLSIEFERNLRKYQHLDSLKALIYDACGSAYIEEICNRLSEQFEDETKLYTTNRYSPGYGDLLLENQKKFYNILSLNKMGVELTNSNLMIPRKTVTAIIGLSNTKHTKVNFVCDCEECVIPCRKLLGGN